MTHPKPAGLVHLLNARPMVRDGNLKDEPAEGGPIDLVDVPATAAGSMPATGTLRGPSPATIADPNGDPRAMTPRAEIPPPLLTGRELADSHYRANNARAPWEVS